MNNLPIQLKYKALFSLLLLFIVFSLKISGQEFLKQHQKNFENPPMDCWPHTRWWWPGNVTNKENITYELEQMRSHGIRGVGQITMSSLYEKGNIKYLSDAYLELVKYTVKESKRLGMEVSFNFGGPGWIIGGAWVTEEDKSKDMIPTFLEVSGPKKINLPVADDLIKTNRSWEIYNPKLSGVEKLLAVVAGKLNRGKVDPASLTVITDKVKNNKIYWKVPKGKWKIMFFWLAIDKSHQTVNHFDAKAMQRYCDYLGGKFKDAVGEEFGKTVESFFCDSFELPYQASGIKWSDGLLQKFKEEKKYDLTKYLPAIWWEIDGVSPKVRYDVNQFLSETAFDTFFNTFLSWCKKNGVKGRIQPYGFETDILKGAGLADIPEMEITPGEKDQHDWFDTRIGPKKYVSSGAHIYGKNIISTEANTFLHWERYRATLEEIKIVTDGFLRFGANKFYTHGYSSSLERDLAPSRRTVWATQVNPTNTWWKYYLLFAEYIARSSYILRQGDFAPDIAVYSPLANQWTKDVLNARRWTRDFDWGDLGNLLLSNGYDFDLLNDDALQNLASFENGIIKIRNLKYKILLLPNVESLPLKTLKRIEQYVQGGGVVIALDRLPVSSTGFINDVKKDKEVSDEVSNLFKNLTGNNTTSNQYGKGYAHFLKKVIHREIWWDQYSSKFDPFLKVLKSYISPDFEIDFNKEELRRNKGLSFLHRKIGDSDLYFVSNIQDQSVAIPINFRVKNKNVWEWNPYNGDITELFQYSQTANGTKLPIKLAPWESTIIVFEKGKPVLKVNKTNLDKINSVSDKEITGEVSNNGSYYAVVNGKGKERVSTFQVDNIPAPFVISGNWNMILKNDHFKKIEKELKYLSSWTDDEKTKHFSGTGKYRIKFDLPGEYVNEDLKLFLELGKIGNIGEVLLNWKNAGVIWMKGQTCDITKLARKGENELVIFITNTNINRVSGFKKLTPVPAEIQKKYGNTKNAGLLPREFGFKPLPPSGLMGPVIIKVVKKIRINYNQ